MIARRIAALLFVMFACVFGAALLGARGQTPRPGDMTQAHVWVENRSSNEAIPVVVERMVEPRVHVASVDASIVLPTRAARQGWEYRSIALGTRADPAIDLERPGNEGWEAVGILQSGPAGTTVLLKRPR
jgi:hypothetical protein